MPTLKLCLLGSFQAFHRRIPLTDFESDKARALLAYLAVEYNRPHRREFLAGLFWPETPERAARTNLRSALANLRQVIHDHQVTPPYLKITRQTIQFNQDADSWVDVNLFINNFDRYSELQLKQTDTELDELTLESTLHELEGAINLYQGEFLSGFYINDAHQFEEWVLITRESLQRQALQSMHWLAEHFYSTGSYEQALHFAQRQTAVEPYQEVAQQQVMWTLALMGRRSEAIAHYERFRELLQTELGVEPLEQTQEMYAQLLAGELPGSPITDLILRREPRAVGDCPYRGLDVFREVDASFFFGREEITDRLAEVVAGPTSLAAIVGASGSGKSSALYAGLIPKIRTENNWTILDFRPGTQPFLALSTTLTPILNPQLSEPEARQEAQALSESLQQRDVQLFDVLQKVWNKSTTTNRMLLVIDQFEELFTLCPDAEIRRRFLDVLLGAVEAGNEKKISPIVVLIAMRADFMGQALSYRPFADVLEGQLTIIGPMNQTELRAAIEKPALKQGSSFEPGLPSRILNDVGDEPGNLPLLEFALTLLWDQLDQGWLTHAAYEDTGEVKGALVSFAEEVFLALNKIQQENTRRIFVQLVQPGRGTEDTRRLATRDEFGDENWELIQHLANKRLVVTGSDSKGRETVEIIHEVLIGEWNRLRDWMDSDRNFRIWQEDLRTAYDQWEESDRSNDALLRGVALGKAENWLNERDDDLSEMERQFIQASLKEKMERQAEERLRQERERSLEQRSRTILRILVVVLLLATAISIGFAWVARSEARQAIEASSLSLAANANQALNDKDSTSAMLLAMAANRIENPPTESQRILLDAAFSPGPREALFLFETVENAEGPALSLVVSPDGRTALIGLFDGKIILWDIENRREIRRFDGHSPGKFHINRTVQNSGVNDLAFSPDGDQAISGGDDGAVILWDVNTGEEVRRFEGHTGAVRTVEISPDGLTAVSGGLSGESLNEPGELVLWDLNTGKELRRFDGNAGAVVDLSISPDGGSLIASSGEVDYLGTPFQSYSLILWDIETGEIIHDFGNLDRDNPAVSIGSVCTHILSEKGTDQTQTTEEQCTSYAITGSTDHNLYQWDIQTRELIKTLEGHSDLVTSLAISPDGRKALSGDGNGEVILWNLDSGEIIARFNAHSSWITDIVYNPDGRSAFSLALDGRIIQWDLHNAAQINRFEGHKTAVLDVAYIPETKQFVSVSGSYDPAAPIIEEESMRIWNLETKQQTGSLDWYLSDIFQVAISPDGRRALSGMMVDQIVRLWDLATGREIRRFEGHNLPVLSVAFLPDGSKGVSGAVDGMIILWDLNTGREIRRFLGHEGGIWALDVSPDGSTALSGSDDYLVIMWDLETGEEIKHFVGHEDTVSGVAFSPDGLRAVSGDTGGSIIEWDLETGTEIHRFSGHGGTGPVGRTRVAYHPNGEIILSSGWDGTLALWDLKTGEEIHRFRGHDTDFIFDVAISPDGESALSCGTDQTIIQWGLDIPPLEELTEWIEDNRFVRDPTCDERELYQIEPLCSP
jgi:WD40 repeat protein/DNA-binding SARP family transcriptional activator